MLMILFAHIMNGCLNHARLSMYYFNIYLSALPLLNQVLYNNEFEKPAPV